MRKKFVWEPWEDPINPEVPFSMESMPWEEGEGDIQQGCPMAHTPFGFLPITENNKASNRFVFWVLHTNFDITGEIERIIDRVPGVETLEVMTRYRMRIGFPNSELFDIKHVRKNVEKAIVRADHIANKMKLSLFDEEVSQKAASTCEDLAENNDYWGIYVVPNGNISVVTAQNLEQYPQFMDRLHVFEAAQYLVGGQVVSSE